jgi:hypothetical protein
MGRESRRASRHHKRFVQNLEARGFTPIRKMTGRGFAGLKLNRPNYEDAHWQR